MIEIEDSARRLSAIRTGIAHAATLARRTPDDVTLIAISKTHGADEVLPLIEAGQRVFGENRLQEAQAKWLDLRAAYPDVRLHFVGQLQSNKAEATVALFDAIHSIDRPSLVDAVAAACAKLGRRPTCFLQVNIGAEPQKGGCAIADLPGLLEQTRGRGLTIAGLMCVPPADTEAAPYFALLAKLARDHAIAGLSMGMSGDYEAAVMLGATHIRVGTALLEPLMTPRAILFDFDGVLIESEYAGNKLIAGLFTAIGHPTTPQESMSNFMGLSGGDFIAAIERWIDRPVPADFHEARSAEQARFVAEGIEAVAGAVAFVRSLPVDLPRAICSSSGTEWIRAHLAHIGLENAFAHVYSGKEHVARGKPAPDLYLHAADALGIAIADCAIIEDSAVGAIGALASGARVIGLTAGSHCAPDHAETLRALGVREIAPDFATVAVLLGVGQVR